MWAWIRGLFGIGKGHTRSSEHTPHSRRAPRLPKELAEQQDDRLTGALGRGKIMGQLDRAIDGAAEGESIAVAYVDVDHLRVVNEQHGFLVGDQCLREVVRRLHDCMREEHDAIGRLEADDFLIVFRNLAGRMAAGPFADRVHTLLGEPIKAGDVGLTIAAYCGVANWPLDGRSASELVKAAASRVQDLKAAAHAAAALAGEAPPPPPPESPPEE